ncbi:dienelactone hydrolase family protein [Nocardia harenae]|uniref:dienelactone hydrolase family protein n=1 Tax=Nocardia harenae TaxID=358707 RepID=UPI000833637F|nr:dienelactone hydrolase family protein [Nocardia harenae]
MPGTYDDIAPLRRGDEADGDQTTAGGSPSRTDRVPITVLEPEGNARGGIVLLHESRERGGALRDLMTALAAEGWTVVTPDLFHRGTGESEVFGDELFDDFDACFDWLTAHGVFPDCVGVLGFDTAGTAAFLVATNRRIGAAVSVGASGLTEPLTAEAEALVQAAPRLQAPWLGLFGADAPADEVEKLRDAGAAAAVATLVVTYPDAKHRADRPAGDEDDDPVRVDAQTRIFDWFDSNLR